MLIGRNNPRVVSILNTHPYHHLSPNLNLVTRFTEKNLLFLKMNFSNSTKHIKKKEYIIYSDSELSGLIQPSFVNVFLCYIKAK